MKLWFRKGVWLSKRGRKILETFNPSGIRRVTVIRHAALGDMILTRNFLIELRRLSPNANITLSVVSHYISGIPNDLVDKVHTLNSSNHALKYWRTMRELDVQDVIFDLAATTRSMWLCKVNRATLKIGFPYRPVQRFFYDVVVPRTDLNFEVDDMLTMLKIFGHVPETPHVYNVPGIPFQGAKPYILYFTTASTITKCWPRERFLALIDRMAVAIPTSDHYVLAGKEEWESTDGMRKNVQYRSNVSFVSADTVDEIICFVKGATMVISNDTSVRNIAIAADVPSVGLFLNTALFRYSPTTEHHRIVFNRDGGMPTVDQVFESSLALLEKIRG